ncbi:hypothetical protein [Jiangella asiatica]|uniref:Uncharacterized protein n=1 Tax=Jiangella asiatica TaxID=2530372 RepID=A0A4R5CEA1_9ACTN|nr:hypothetical protein [Jiangella asiatica]TDD97246.1 hypothetical protein E1269_29805 [Jiangella asiatica]
MALARSSDQGELRAAIEGLLRTWVDLDRQADNAARASREQAHRVARQLVGLRQPGLSGLADEVTGIGTLMSADVTRKLAEVRAPYVAEVHQLLGLLAPLHGVASVPPLAWSSAAVADLAGAFPAGFARDYVADLVKSVERSVTLELEAAGRVVSQPDVDGVMVALGSGFSDAHRAEGVALLRDAICHAVQRHGPQISDDAQLARLIWLKDPSGQNSWQITSNESVQTGHRCGVVCGGFTSSAALAKPIEALLEVAHERAGDLATFLSRNAGLSSSIGVHVSAQLARLEPGDASGYHGAGTGTRETRRDWVKARAFGLAEGRATVYGVAYDPIATGTDPGATLVFKKSGNDWRMVTCYPVGEPKPTDARLEDLT